MLTNKKFVIFQKHILERGEKMLLTETNSIITIAGIVVICLVVLATILTMFLLYLSSKKDD